MSDPLHCTALQQRSPLCILCAEQTARFALQARPQDMGHGACEWVVGGMLPGTVLSSRGVMWAISGFNNARLRALRLVARAAVLGHHRLCLTALTQRLPACCVCTHPLC